MNLKPGDEVPKPGAPPAESEISQHWRSAQYNDPIVSIICHTFNHEKFIKDALNGFLMQVTDFPFEIIVHDDASTDATRSVLHEYQRKYPTILKVILQEKNQFSRGIRPPNFTFSEARGQYIALCEGDDYWFDEEKLQKQVDYLKSHPKCVVVYGDSIPFENGIVIDRRLGGARRDLSSEELRKMCGIFTMTACFRNIVDVPPEANVVGYGDMFLWARLGRHGHGAFLSELVPAFYRVHSGGIHSMVEEEQRRRMLLRTLFGMYSYFGRQEDWSLEKYYRQEILKALLRDEEINIRLLPIARVVTRIGRKFGDIRSGLRLKFLGPSGSRGAE